MARAGAAYAGFVFFAPSPRNLTLAEARRAALAAPVGLAKVALVVDADDAALDAIVAAVPLDMIQLHGHETPDRVAAVRARYGLPVMKVLGIADEGDLAAIAEAAAVADQIIFAIDAKPPREAALPGGNGRAFDWRLIAGRRWPVPWMLAGGLAAGNVAEAQLVGMLFDPPHRRAAGRRLVGRRKRAGHQGSREDRGIRGGGVRRLRFPSPRPGTVPA